MGMASTTRAREQNRAGRAGAPRAYPQYSDAWRRDHVAASPDGRNGTGKHAKLPKNRARTIILLTILAIVVVIFGYMLLVSQVGR
jgi:hypothetical protein